MNIKYFGLNAAKRLVALVKADAEATVDKKVGEITTRVEAIEDLTPCTAEQIQALFEEE